MMIFQVVEFSLNFNVEQVIIKLYYLSLKFGNRDKNVQTVIQHSFAQTWIYGTVTSYYGN